jgi:Bacterial membrane protein YfhO
MASSWAKAATGPAVLRTPHPGSKLRTLTAGVRRGAHLGLVGIAVVFNLVVLRGETVPVQNFNDSSFHLAMIRWARSQWLEGTVPLDGWFPNLSEGSAMFHHYQSLEHVLTGAAAVFVGSDNAFYWELYILLASWPISVYAGARLLGLTRWSAGAAALVAPLAFSVTGYGFEDTSYTWWGLGLWSQLWGMWLEPLAWGLTWRAVDGRGGKASMLLGAASLGFTIALHFLTGYLAIVMVAVWVVVRPRQFLPRLGRALAVWTGAAAIAAWAIVPLVQDAAYQGGSQSSRGTFWDDSFGAARVLSWLVTGQIFDWNRLPVVTLLVAAGLVACLVMSRSGARALALPGAFVASLFLFFGRATWGPLADLLPGGQDLLFHRFISGVHLAGILIAGVGMTATASLVGRLIWLRAPWRRPAWAAVPVVMAGLVVLAPAWLQIASYRAQDASVKQYQALQQASDGANLDFLIAEVKVVGGGRVYAGASNNWGTTYKIGEVPVYIVLANEDVPEVGFYLRVPSLMADPEASFDEKNLWQYDLFNIRYLILPAGHQPPVPARLLDSRGRHDLYTVDTSGYLEVVDTVGPPLVMNRTNVAARAQPFMESTELARLQFPIVAFAGQPAAQPTLTGAVSGPAGSVLTQSDQQADGWITGEVTAERPAGVVLKASYDPRWHATLDGVEVQTYMVAPAFVAISVPPGTHFVTFRYQPYPYYPLLFAIGGVAVLLLFSIPRWLRSRT